MILIALITLSSMLLMTVKKLLSNASDSYLGIENDAKKES